MRKQDRMAQEQQNHQQDMSKKDSSKPQPREQERMRGRASDERPPRQPGSKLPLPQ
jgi:hypothetical protein